jgi:hypothetical protein
MKTKISEYSTTNSSNTDIEGINIDEGCPPSSINNAIRELMVHLKEFQTGASGDAFTFAGGTLMSGTNTISGAAVISGNINSSGTTNTFSGGNILSGTNTISGSAIISGNINSSGSANTFSGGVVHSGTNTFSSSVIISGNINSSGSTNTFSGANIISGNINSSGSNTFSGTQVISGGSTFSGAAKGTLVTDNDGSFDMTAGNNFTCTPTGSITLTFTNITSGQSGNILLVNGSNYTVSAHTNTKVGTGVLTALSATGTYWVSYFSNGTNVYLSATGALA